MAADEPTVVSSLVDDDVTSPIVLRPQLRLHHFFALTAVAAALLAINGPQSNYWGDANIKPPQLILALFTAYGISYVLLISVAVTSVAYGIAWQRQGLVFFDQPGHWLLVEIGITGLLSLVPTIVYRWMFSSVNSSDLDFPMTSAILVGVYSLVMLFLLPLALNIYIGIKKCRERRWKVVFFIKSVANLLFGIGTIAIPVSVLIAARIDRRERVPRDVGHWCGVWLQLAYSVLQIAVAVVSILNAWYMFSRA
jgi:hypothetical protein